MGLKLQHLRSGDAGTWQTVQVIRRFIAEGRVDPFVRKQVIAVIGAGSRQPEREISALLNFVRRRIRYVADPVDTEFVASARRVLEIGGGDCDDLVVLLGALLESIGYETQVKIMAVNQGEDYHHVYLEVKLAGAWLPLDPTSRTGGLGWEYPVRGRQHTFGIPRPKLGGLNSDGGYDPRVVDAIIGKVPYEELKAELRKSLRPGYSSADLAAVKQWLAHEAAFTISAVQRRLLRDLLEEAQRVQYPAALAGLRGGLRGFLDDLWKGFKGVLHVIGTVAGTLGPIFAVIPGVGTVVAAVVTVGGQVLYSLTDKQGKRIGYVPGNTLVDANGNLVLDSATLQQLAAGQTSTGAGSSWWLYLAIGGLAALMLTGGRR